MEEWIRTPVVVVALIGVGTLIWKAAGWATRIDSEVIGLKALVKEVRDEIRGIRQEVRGEIRQIRQEVRGEIREVRGEIREVRGEIRQIRGEFTEIRGQFTEVRGEYKENRDEIEKFKGKLRQITREHKEIKNDIKGIFSRLPPPPTAGLSPLRLTDFGETISEEIGAQDWASAIAESLMGEVEGKEPFEIDDFCKQYVRTRLDQRWERKVAVTAYEFGRERDVVRAVLRVVLRDALLRRTAGSDESPSKR